MYIQGEIIAAKLPMGVEHYGISTGCGTVISASMRAGVVIEESLEVFSGGHPIISKGYPSDLMSGVILAKARNAIGHKWNLFTGNCQHFATWCHGNKHSPQLQWAASGALLLMAFIFVPRVK
jgi:hypothetical protein